MATTCIAVPWKAPIATSTSSAPSPEEVQVTVAKIRAEVDVQIKEMDMADKEAERAHELRMKGVDVIADAVTKGTEPIEPPTPPAAEGA